MFRYPICILRSLLGGSQFQIELPPLGAFVEQSEPFVLWRADVALDQLVVCEVRPVDARVLLQLEQ